MIIVFYFTILLTVTAAIETVAENVSSELSNDIEGASKNDKMETLITTAKSTDSEEKFRRGRYLRQFHRPMHRLSPNFPMKNSRRPWKYFNSYGKTGNYMNNFNRPPYPSNNRNNYNSLSNHSPQKFRNHPFQQSSPNKFRFGNGKHNWRNKWPAESGRFPSSMNFPPTAEDNGESYDEYLDMYDYAPDEEMGEGLATDEIGDGMYNDADEDTLPVSSRYSEKRSPFKYLLDEYSSFADSSLPPKISRGRVKYNREENIPRNGHFHRKYRPNDGKHSVNIRYQEPVTLPTHNRNQNHRFKLINLSELKMLQNSNDGEVDVISDDPNNDEDQYDFPSGKSSRYIAREHSVRFNDEDSVHHKANIGQRDFFKESREEKNHPVKRQPSSSPQNIQDVVYSSRYRNNNSETRSGDDEYLSEKLPHTGLPKRSVSKKSKQNKMSTTDKSTEEESDSNENNSNEDNIMSSNFALSSETNDMIKEMRKRRITKNNLHGHTQTISLSNVDNHQQTVTPNRGINNEEVKNEDDQLLPSELIAYMSVNPSEPVINKEERFTMSSYPFIRTLDSQFIKPVTSYQDVEINLDQYTPDWKNQLLV